MSSGPRFRFAPSPTGSFHVGGARTALQNWALARRLGGTFVLRIEDTDEARNRPEWTQGIIDALAWIGISAADDSHFEGPHFQSEFADAHVAAARKLFDDGHAYYCDLTAEQIQERAKELGHQRLRRATRAIAGSSRAPVGAAVPCAARNHGCPRPGARRCHASTTTRSKTSCCCAATAHRCSCWPTWSTTSRWRSPMWCVPRSICPTRPNSRCCGRRSVISHPGGVTCRCWSTSSARSCRSDATRWRSSSTATTGTSPTPWSTT